MPQGKVIAVQPARAKAPTTLEEESLKKVADGEAKTIKDSTTDSSATETEMKGMLPKQRRES